MFKHFNRQYSIKTKSARDDVDNEPICRKCIILHVASDNSQVSQSHDSSLSIDIYFLRMTIRQTGDLWLGKFLTLVFLDQGSATSARNKLNEPHPQPKSNISIPSTNSAFEIYDSNISCSASSRVSFPLEYKQHEYFNLGPKHLEKKLLVTS